MFNVVTDLCEDFLNKKHHVYADNAFTSFQLAKHLLEQETYLNGTLRANAKHLSETIRRPGAMARGDVKVRKATDAAILTTVWKDKKEVKIYRVECKNHYVYFDLVFGIF